MNDFSATSRFHSAKIRMHLTINGAVFTIGHLGPDFLILDNPTDHPPAEAKIDLSIDGRARSWIVNLPDGIIAGQPETRIIRRESVTKNAQKSESISGVSPLP